MDAAGAKRRKLDTHMHAGRIDGTELLIMGILIEIHSPKWVCLDRYRVLGVFFCLC